MPQDYLEYLQIERAAGTGLISLNRPRALNALSLDMVRGLLQTLEQWRADPLVGQIAIRGMGREGPFGCFCAGGDIRFFHQAAIAGDPALEDFFTEEYTLNHVLHHYPKPVLAFMDGVVMGGGMGVAQGASIRIATDRTRMAMPETMIGLFPDVGGGWFLSRCPGRLGEYLALTGQTLDGAQALGAGLADALLPSANLHEAWQDLALLPSADADALARWQTRWLQRDGGSAAAPPGLVDRHFGLPDVPAIIASLESAAASDSWAAQAAAALRARSPLLLHVSLAQVRRGRSMSLADELRMERDLVRHCFHPVHLARRGAATDTVEGIRALAVDKDHAPRWNPSRIEEVTQDMVEPFFASPWPAWAHPLRALA